MAKPKESTFVLLSLKDTEAKRLGQVISSETARKILDTLAEKKHTESELAEKLQIPLSTVHYNIKALVEAKLVTADEYHYSAKGREVTHYGLANKYVIIAPAGAESGVLDKIKALLPVAILTAAVGWTIQWFNAASNAVGTIPTVAPMLAQEAAADSAMIAAEAMPAAKSLAMQAPAVAAQAAPPIETMGALATVPEPTTQLPIGLIFTLGAAFAITLYLIIEALWKRWN